MTKNMFVVFILHRAVSVNNHGYGIVYPMKKYNRIPDYFYCMLQWDKKIQASHNFILHWDSCFLFLDTA